MRLNVQEPKPVNTEPVRKKRETKSSFAGKGVKGAATPGCHFQLSLQTPKKSRILVKLHT